MVFRIKEARERAGLSQKQLAESLNIKPNTFSGYETGAHDPKSNILLSIAKKCNTTVDFLLGLTDNPNVSNELNNYINEEEKKYLYKYNQLDLYGKNTVNAVINKELERIQDMQNKINNQAEKTAYRKTAYYDMPVCAGTGNPLDYENLSSIYIAEEIPPLTDYVLRISGNSMEPTFYDGDYIYVQKKDSLNFGDIGIFIIDGSVYLKEYAREGLISHNSDYPVIHGDENIRCLGKVLGKVEGEIHK